MTAHDIQSSLYYLHVHGPDDENIRRDEEKWNAQANIERSEAPHTSASITQRKPLPPKPALAPPQTYPPLPLPDRHSPWDSQVTHNPVDHGLEAGSPELQIPGPKQPSRLLGPRPMYPETSHNSYGVLNLAPDRVNVDLRRRSAPPAEPTLDIPMRPSPRRKDIHSERNPRESTNDVIVPEKKGLRFLAHSRGNSDSQAMHNGDLNYFNLRSATSDTCLSITLIRRDPHSGGQWNVARISSSPARRNVYASSPSSILIDINTPGYKRLQDQYTDHGAVSNTPNATFRLSLGNTSRKDDLTWVSHHHRTHEVDGALRSSIECTGDGEPYNAGFQPLVSPDRSSTKDGTCSFRSPWNGLCEFSPGMTGRSLKCRHQRTSTTLKPIMVSELRFNLPSHSLFSPPPRSPMQGAAAQQRERSSFFPRKHVRRSSRGTSSDENDNDAGYGVSLGQEKAGGGFGGKQAKLGKLIIEDEGQKMLDLVVAANMAMWWRVYERSGVAFPSH